MGFQFVPKSLTLNDPDWRNSRYFAELGSFGADYVKMVEDRLIMSATKM